MPRTSGRKSRRAQVRPAVAIRASRRGFAPRLLVLTLLAAASLGAALAAQSSSQGRTIVAAVQHFLLFYSGVFALIALTAAVGVGLAASDRIVMVPSTRVLAQALHRAASLAAVAFLATHIVVEVLAHRSHVADAFVPFLASVRTFYIGLGTIASDLVILIVATGILRGRFAVRSSRWTWRALHATAYLAWPLAIVHGLLGGRAAKPYVDWSYGACLALAALALAIRLVATVRSRRSTVGQAVPERASWPAHVAPVISQAKPPDQLAMVPRRQPRPRRALPPAPGPGRRP